MNYYVGVEPGNRIDENYFEIDISYKGNKAKEIYDGANKIIEKYPMEIIDDDRILTENKAVISIDCRIENQNMAEKLEEELNGLFS